MFSFTKILFEEIQTYPQLNNLAFTAKLLANSTSESGKTIKGSLPPNSFYIYYYIFNLIINNILL